MKGIVQLIMGVLFFVWMTGAMIIATVIDIKAKKECIDNQGIFSGFFFCEYDWQRSRSDPSWDMIRQLDWPIRLFSGSDEPVNELGSPAIDATTDYLGAEDATAEAAAATEAAADATAAAADAATAAADEGDYTSAPIDNTQIYTTEIPSNWELIDKNEDAKYYIDPGTIRTESNYTLVWGLINFSKLQTLSSQLQYKSGKSLDVYNCQEMKIGIKDVLVYRGDVASGPTTQIASRDISEVDFMDVVPGTISESLFKRVCGY